MSQDKLASGKYSLSFSLAKQSVARLHTRNLEFLRVTRMTQKGDMSTGEAGVIVHTASSLVAETQPRRMHLLLALKGNSSPGLSPSPVCSFHVTTLLSAQFNVSLTYVTLITIIIPGKGRSSLDLGNSK